jgi:hypothetical protein
VNQPKGNRCPECDALRQPDHTPSCGCGQQAAEALRDARTADAAAAGDFDPLRIRPYVELDTGGENAPPADVEATMALRTVEIPPGDGTTAPPPGTASASASDASDPDVSAPAVSAPDATMALRAVMVPPSTASVPSLRPPGAMPALAPVPDAADLSLFADPENAAGTAGAPTATVGDGDGSGVGDGTGNGAAPDGTPRRRRRGVLPAAAVAVVAVAVGAAFAGGLFSYRTPSHDGAPQEVRAAVPEVSESAAIAAASVGASAIVPASSAPAPTVTASATAAPPSPTPSPSASQSTKAATATATARAEHTKGSHDHRNDTGTAVLKRGDSGSDVVELQERLTQLSLYMGQADGNYSSMVEAAVTTYQWARGLRDDLGVYDAATRAMLESETTQP